MTRRGGGWGWQESSEEGRNHDYCDECGNGGNLVCCDGCPAAYHTWCIGVQDASMLPGEAAILPRVRGHEGRGRRSRVETQWRWATAVLRATSIPFLLAPAAPLAASAASASPPVPRAATATTRCRSACP